MVLPCLWGVSLYRGVIHMVKPFWLFLKYKGSIYLLSFNFWVKDRYNPLIFVSSTLIEDIKIFYPCTKEYLSSIPNVP